MIQWRSWELRTVRTVRLALATIFAMLLSQAIPWPWPLSFITPVLVVALYEIPLNQPSLAEFGKDLLTLLS
jgi:hypothetical protein